MGNILSFYKEYVAWRTLTKKQSIQINKIETNVKQLESDFEKIKVDVKMLYSSNV